MTGCFVPIRVLIASLMFGGTVISYVLRVNINIAIVAMTMNSEELCVNMTSKDRCGKLRHKGIYIPSSYRRLLNIKYQKCLYFQINVLFLAWWIMLETLYFVGVKQKKAGYLRVTFMGILFCKLQEVPWRKNTAPKSFLDHQPLYAQY